jgi:hypothetical protein
LTKAPKTYDEEKTASSTNVARKTDICLQKTEARSMFVTLYMYQLKTINNLNIRPETLKLVQEKAGNTLEAIGIASNFLSRTQFAQQLRKRMDK